MTLDPVHAPAGAPYDLRFAPSDAAIVQCSDGMASLGRTYGGGASSRASDSTRRAVYRLILGVKYLTPLLLLTIAASSCMHRAPDTPGAMPDNAQKALNRMYPGWKPAVFAPSDAACRDRAGATPTILTDDLNSDGFADWVLQIQTADAIKLVVVMGWLSDYRPIEVESWSGSQVDRFLAKFPRGTKYTNPLTKSADYLGHNSFATVTCAGEKVFYFWDGDSFQKVIPGKVTTNKKAQ